MAKQYLYTETVSSQRRIKTAAEIIPVTGEGYTSLFYFDHQIIDHMSKEKTVSNFKGNVYGNYFVLDLDSKDIPNLVKDLVPLLDFLKANDVKHYLFFSGNKGFHLYIPKEYVKYDDRFINRWNEISRMFAEILADKFPALKPYIDLGVYDKVRIFRLPYSIHQISGGEKVLLQYTKLNKENPIQSFVKVKRSKKDVMKEIFVT